MAAGQDAGQDADPDIGPIMKWKRAGSDQPRWEDISLESRETKVLWRQWERLHLVRGVLHRRFYELEGQGWRHQLVVPEDRRRTILQQLHGGAIRELHSDQGTNFGSKMVLEVCRLFGIHKTRTTQYHPRSARFIERSYRALGRCLKAACSETKQKWDELVLLILMSYWATPQASTGVTPDMMMLGRQTRLPVQAMYETPLGPDEDMRTVSEYVTALREGLQ